jgi:FkbM family methyltransferase
MQPGRKSRTPVKTIHKVMLARMAYYPFTMARRLLGRSDIVEGSFDGLNYRLDLSQGIDFAIYLLGRFEPSTAAAISRVVKPGDIALDIGANIGAHTLRIARAVGETGRVLAFEPTEFAFGKLVTNLGLNPSLKDRVTAIQCFLGSSATADPPPMIYSSWPLTKGSDLHKVHLGASMSTGQATTQRLDDVIAQHNIARVDVVKMDVDGFECEVLDGAKLMMERDRPTYIMEMSPYVLEERGSSFDKLLDRFLSLDYQFFTLKGENPLPRYRDDLARIIGPGASINVIARATRLNCQPRSRI